MTCIMCDAIGSERHCTLHGGHMTATEVNLRDLYQISNGRWIEAPTTLADCEGAMIGPTLDKMVEWAKRITSDTQDLALSDAIDRMTKRK